VKLRDFLPQSAFRAFDRAVAKSWAAVSMAWRRGERYHRGPGGPPRPSPGTIGLGACGGQSCGRRDLRKPLKFYQGDTGYGDAAFDAWWAEPALGSPMVSGVQPRLSLADVLRDLAAWAKLEGEFFLLFDDTWALAAINRRNPNAFTPFLIARPDRVRLIIQSGQIEGYEYVDAGGHRSIFLPEQVLHWKAFNPYDDFRDWAI